MPPAIPSVYVHNLSTKDLVKAIDRFLQDSCVTLPDELAALLDEYSAKSEKGDESGLNDELLAIFDRTVLGHPSKYASFLVLLRHLTPVFRDPALLNSWGNKLTGPILDAMSHQKGLANETLNNVVALCAMDIDAEEGTQGSGLNPFAQQLLQKWMDTHLKAQTGDETSSYTLRMVAESLMVFGKKDPKKFMTALNDFIIRRETCNQALSLLTEFIRSEPPHLHLVLETPLFGSILQLLQRDTSITTVALGLVALNMLLPYIPSFLVPFLPTLFNIYARLLFWDKPFAAAQLNQDARSDVLPDADLEENRTMPDWEPHTVPHLSEYFTFLYGLYPINFLEYIRKPHRYLRHANNADDLDVQATELRDRSERFRKYHLLHSNFYNLTIESEKTDLDRWANSEAHEVVADCMALSVMTQSASESGVHVSAAAQPLALDHAQSTDKEPASHALLSISLAGDAASSRESLTTPFRTSLSGPYDSLTASSSAQMARQNSQSSQVSTRASRDERSGDVPPDSPTLPPHLVQSPSTSQLQDLIQSNKAIKAGMHQGHGNDSVLSLAISHQDSMLEKRSGPLPSLQQPSNLAAPSTSTAHVDAMLSQAWQQNLLLQNDLQFERYIKEQHMAHIGELRRKQLREEATEAETQNLLMVTRNMRRSLQEAKLAEAQLKKETDNRRNMSKKWEADLSNKLRTLREEQKTWATRREELERGLDKAQSECKRLEALMLEADAQKLKADQALEAADMNAKEVELLKGEITRLTALEREFQGKERTMQIELQAAAAAKAQAGQLAADLAGRTHELHEMRQGYESQLAMVQTQLEEVLRTNSSKTERVVLEHFESAVAASQAKYSELQKQYSALVKKNTVLQSALLDMQVEASAPRLFKSHDRTRTRDHEGHSSVSVSSSPVDIRSRGHGALGFDAGGDGSLAASGSQTPSTPVNSPPDQGPSKNSPERYFGRGGVQNTIRKERKDKDDKDKKDKKSTGMQRIRDLI